MADKTHYLHLYNRHKTQVTQGKKFLRRMKAINYKHRIDGMGWFDTMTCEIDLPLYDIWQAVDPLHGWLMREVNVIVDNPYVPVWEGFVSRVVADLPNGTLTVSMDNVANRVTIVYTGSGATVQTTQTANADSIALYGSKMETLEMGDNAAGGATMPTDLQSKTLAQQAFPEPAFLRGSNPRIKISLECLGVYHTLKWDAVAVTNTSVFDAWTIAALFMITGYGLDFTSFNSSTKATGNGNGVFYYDIGPGGSAPSKYFTTNTAFTLTSEKRRGQTIWDKVLQVTEAGDGVNDYVVGIRPTDPNTRLREPYYNPANIEVAYTARAFGDGRIRNVDGGVVAPWEVIPDRSIRIIDILQGYDGVTNLDDPRVIWIRAIEYDAEARNGAGDVQWISSDDYTVPGQFKINEYAKPTSSKLATAPRYF